MGIFILYSPLFLNVYLKILKRILITIEYNDLNTYTHQHE
ncbi:hypothetical protein L291_4256 [Acinetobacter guillouiae MSP4-18]|nr:hypothetical protein L291_4256 [Acinetobacter guillouiae MSP4-18]